MPGLPFQQQKIQVLAFWSFIFFLAFFDPEIYSNGAGFTYLHIKEKMAAVGWFGNTMTKRFIPEARTNLVFVSFSYYNGWLFDMALVFILSLFIARIVSAITKAKDSHGKLLLVGAVTLYTFQFVYNIGMSVGFLPLTTMSLPFLSYGLMPILLNAILVGIVLSVYRRKDLISTAI
ncbi:FtsW/RodA/SpoVE family cell cycle protein [Peribacillus glennii]|uniref:FtsW/RodA/SpoVE family cell cycle protein n=1 Tax=Peribacillus glennii TaxID=2303991 RepID=A0A372L810_9BACI|nr:FtsW/RodA/SpoVE family cell cycle protein [Peribacillus glennii]RFU61444.1 FtsW/RodA/SpoVE family cell cycle protein [Peribacillus glennii]